MNRKIAYAIPNLFTAASLVCGLVALNQVVNAEFINAAWLITLAMIFDGFDGRMARLLNATSKFGSHADSLSDFVAFGVAPAFLAWEVGLKHFGILGYFISILYVLCGGFRLARFNVLKLKSSDFMGLPIPAAAGTICSFILFNEIVLYDTNTPFILICLLPFLCFLMVSRIPYLAVNKKQRKKKYIIPLIIFALLLAVVTIKYTIWVYLISSWVYIFYGLFNVAKKAVNKKQQKLILKRVKKG
jgi:CDP-diacylglycerol--serine O-phosphatidyltransferase